MPQDKDYIKLVAPDGLGSLLVAVCQQLDRAGSLGMIESLNPANWAELTKATMELARARLYSRRHRAGQDHYSL